MTLLIQKDGSLIVSVTKFIKGLILNNKMIQVKLFNTLLFLILINLSVKGQNNLIEPTELDGLYVRALNSRIDLLLYNEWKYIKLNEYE